MVRSNDANRGLFNGDIGLCLADADGALRVYFRCESDVRSFSVDDLPPHESAFALTVHKSQGSEYQQVTIVLPPEPQHALHSRQLLYTALTRAKSSLKLYASDEVVGACLAYQERRLGGLFDALNQRL